MLRISDTRIDELIAEDIPYVDLTCNVNGLVTTALYTAKPIDISVHMHAC